MGARQYHPILGRFLEVDPIEGGVHNDYGYVGDGVNSTDLTGTAANGACMVASVGVIFVVEGTICYWKDEKGRELYTWGAGVGVGWAVASLGISAMWSNVSNVRQITGWSACGSVGFVIIVGGGAVGCAWETRGNRYYTWGWYGASGAKGPSVTATAAATGEAPSWIKSLLSYQYDGLKYAVNNRPVK